MQPNPWFRRSTPYVPRVPDRATTRLERIVPIGYRALVARGTQLRQLGVNFVDTSGILDGEPSSAYSDDVGHFSPAGYDLLARAIIGAIASVER